MDTSIVLASDSHSKGPDLVGVARRASPDLEDLTIRLLAIRKVNAESLVLKRNSVVVGEIPRLSWKVVVAVPKLQFGAVGGAGTGIQAHVVVRGNQLSWSTVDLPELTAALELDLLAIARPGLGENAQAFVGASVEVNQGSGWGLGGHQSNGSEEQRPGIEDHVVRQVGEGANWRVNAIPGRSNTRASFIDCPG